MRQSTSSRRHSYVSLLLFLLILACGTAPVTTQQPSGQRLTRAELGGDWPFSTEDGVVSCDGAGGVGSVFFATDGTTYAINGNAIGEGTQPDIRQAKIWSGGDLSPIIERGLTLCR